MKRLPIRLRRSILLVALPESAHVAAGTLPPDESPELASYKTEAGRRFARQIISAERAMKRKDYITAFGLANEALTTFADNPRVMAARAVSAWNLGEYRTTIADATRVMQALTGGNPIMHPMLVARAAASSELGRHADALRDAQKAIELFPQSGRAYLERAIAKEGLRDAPESVLSDFKRAAELDATYTPDYERALARLMRGGEASGASHTTGISSDRAGRAQGILAILAQRGEEALSSNLGFTAIMAALVGLVAVAGFLFSRRS